LNTSRDGDSTSSLGRLLCCLTTLSGKKFFLISDLNLAGRNQVICSVHGGLVSSPAKHVVASLASQGPSKREGCLAREKVLTSSEGRARLGHALPLLLQQVAMSLAHLWLLWGTVGDSGGQREWDRRWQ